MSDPLRTIVERVVLVEGQLWGDRLECGHILNEASDVFGRRHPPKRRRCFKCTLDIEREFPVRCKFDPYCVDPYCPSNHPIRRGGLA